jgi:hypothetical protein
MRLRAEVVRALEAQTMLTMAEVAWKAAEAHYRNADAECRRAWDALTVAEHAMVRVACADRSGPGMARPRDEGTT